MFKRIAALLLALVLMAPAAGLAESKGLSRNGSMIVGSTGDEVKAAQQLLKNYGYFTGEVNGVYGEDTAEAVRAFQKRNSLSVDGKIGKLTLAKMQSGNVVMKGDASTGINGNNANYLSQNGSMVLGSTGDEVAAMQKLLKEYGYYSGSEDGRYGYLMQAAVMAFQKQNGLAVDGKIGAKTYAKLTSGSENVVKKNEGTTAPSMDSKGLSQNGSMVLGSSGVDIMAAQQKLQDYGYYTGLLDGKFSYGMQTAVEAFQRRNGLAADGKIGPKTLAKLYDDPSNIVKKSDPDPEKDTVALVYGSSGEAVKNLQRALKYYYYFTGAVDGIFGTDVLQAVKWFQASAGLTADGKAGYATQNALLNGTAAIFNGGIPIRNLSRGYRGYDVYVLQQKLSSLNYLSLSSVTNGYFDNATVTAITKFQQDKGIAVTGAYDAATRRYLYPTAVDQQEQAAVDEKNAELDIFDQIFDPYVGDTLKLGSTGSQVANAQMKLKAAGYLLDNADGVFGATTEAAVKKLQKDYGLKQDGIIGQDTWIVIRNLNVENAEQKVVIDGSTSVGASTVKLQRGSKGSQVVKLQTKLKEMGYYTGSVDGKFGPATAVAVSKFQLVNGLNPDGIVGTDTYAALQLDYTADPVVITEPTTPEVFTDTKIPDKIQRGNKGNYVKKLQQKLTDQGYYSGDIDGKFGASTEVAVKEFQLAKSLNPDGIAGKDTLVALGLTPDSVSSAKLKRGSSGEGVKMLQQKLKDLGLYTGEIDGKFGASTESAVKQFQKNNGLKEDGIVGPATKEKLGL